ncbi:hypothetical protein DFQ00_12637 [Paenibacillus barcinonensis]|uniref:Uncharacterized protein n=1 Tax=Paenibacillus barcinonensis TaxID=198119 RepID=A0A2V4VY65_PAEBA|nr:hypothetical protein DFQ00_12637 [Paenibacillus barcinonensis]
MLNPWWSAGERSAGGSAFGPLVGPGFLLFPFMGEIPCQTRTLRSLSPIPPSSLPRAPSTASKNTAFASLGNFCSLVGFARLAFHLNPWWSAGERSAGGSAFGPLVGPGFLLFPFMGEIPCQTRTLCSLSPIPPSSLPRLTHVSFTANTFAAAADAARGWLQPPAAQGGARLAPENGCYPPHPLGS